VVTEDDRKDTFRIGAASTSTICNARKPFLGLILTLDARTIVQTASEMDPMINGHQEWIEGLATAARRAPVMRD
jgi:hypothetical protein